MRSFIRFFSILFLCFLLIPLASESRKGADRAAPEICIFLDTLKLQSGQMHTLSDSETLQMIDLASSLHINVFELIDCTYRYTAPRNIRIIISGDSIKKLQSIYDLGKERVLALLPVDKMTKLETGATLAKGQTALDVYLESSHQAYIEIGTAFYEKRFGFARLEPLLFAEPYGITVKKFIFSAPLEKLELYEPGKGAIYAKGFSKPKRWNLWVISKE